MRHNLTLIHTSNRPICLHAIPGNNSTWLSWVIIKYTRTLCSEILRFKFCLVVHCMCEFSSCCYFLASLSVNMNEVLLLCAAQNSEGEFTSCYSRCLFPSPLPPPPYQTKVDSSSNETLRPAYWDCIWSWLFSNIIWSPYFLDLLLHQPVILPIILKKKCFKG